MSLTAFLASPEGVGLYYVLILAGADWLLSVAAAFRDGTFSLDGVAVFLRTHIMGRVVPIAVLLGLGYFGNAPALSAIGAAAAALYTAETLKSIADSWAPGHETQKVPKE